jgi:nitric oxide dioxygenase
MYNNLTTPSTKRNENIMTLTSEQVQIVRSTVPILETRGTEITTHFYKTLLAEKPELNNIFSTVNQANGSQPRALAGALYAYASHLDDLGALSPTIEKICQKHVSLYIQPDHYKVVGEYLLRAMGDVLGAALTKDVLDAWEAAYWQLANLMIAKEDRITKEEKGDWLDWRDFRIASKVKESDEITSFYLQPTDGKRLPSYKPGQYISIKTQVPKLGYMQPRQYSLSDKPSPDYYRISVKKEAGLPTNEPEAVVHPGYISNVLHDEKDEGDILSVSHPAGEFFLDPEVDSDVPVVLISAGVGLTPMVSILNTLLDRGSKQRISFIHGARNTSVRAFREHIQEAAKQHKNVTATFFISNLEPHSDVEGVHYHHAGRVRLDVLDRSRDLQLENANTKYFVCGPESFMNAMEKQLLDLGVAPERINMEVFGTGDVVRV